MRPSAATFPRIVSAAAAAALALSVVSACRTRAPEKKAGLIVAVVPKGMTHEFWKAIHAGAVKASRELGVEIVWKGSQKEDDRVGQVTVVEDLIGRGVDGIVLAPLDDRALMRPVREAKDAGIPVVIIDSPMEGNDFVSYIATDNYRGGVLAARRLAELLGGRGKIFLIRGHEGSASTELREQGFLETMAKEFPGITYLSKDIYAGVTTETAYQALESLLNRFPEVEGLFATHESSTFGCLRALEDKGLAGKIKFVGFDSSIKLADGLRAGRLQGLVLQNPFAMGYLGVKTLVAHLRGEAIPAQVDTGETMATPENMDEPEVRALLFPDIKSWID
jgi:ribose transport system substrate-binding protein